MCWSAVFGFWCSGQEYVRRNLRHLYECHSVPCCPWFAALLRMCRPQDDFVAFLLGCSFSFEEALLAAGVPVRHIEQGKNVPMYVTNIDTVPAGPFRGKAPCTAQARQIWERQEDGMKPPCTGSRLLLSMLATVVRHVCVCVFLRAAL